MSDAQAMVDDFHRTFDIVVNPAPTVVDGRTRELRVTLIQEEFDELKEALVSEDLSSIARRWPISSTSSTARRCPMASDNGSSLSRSPSVQHEQGRW